MAEVLSGIPTLNEMSMAHLRLSQSLRSMSSGSVAYADTEKALSDVAKAIAERSKRTAWNVG